MWLRILTEADYLGLSRWALSVVTLSLQEKSIVRLTNTEGKEVCDHGGLVEVMGSQAKECLQAPGSGRNKE